MKIKGKTSNGFKFEIDDRIKMDWRLLEAIGNVDSGDVNLQIKGLNALVDLILGNNKDEFMKHISKLNDGFVPVDKAIDELREILETTPELKN